MQSFLTRRELIDITELVNEKLLIMNFSNENIGYIERAEKAFIQHLNDKVQEFPLLPPILRDIAPEPTQFPAANDVLDYYNMGRMDVWTYLARSNGFKSSREYMVHGRAYR